MAAADPEMTKLHEALAAVAKKIARLLIQPTHDAAELADLEAQARKLRARIRQAEALAAEQEIVLRVAGNGRLFDL
jgi:hypothetical protein